MFTPVAGMYFAYLALSIFLTVWVARTLSMNGLIFLVDTFHGNRELAQSVNHLLVVGFYLVNLGFVSLRLTQQLKPIDTVQSIEMLSEKMGVVLLTLGFMHFFNICIFNRMRNRAMLRTQPPPVGPGRIITPPPMHMPTSGGPLGPIAPVTPAQHIAPPTGRIVPQAG